MTALPTSTYLSRVPAQFHPDARGRALTVNTAEAETRSVIGDALGGYTLGRALAVNVKTMTATTPQELVAMLREGLTLTMSCRSRSGGRAAHRLSFAADGTITMHHHRDVDIEVERVMGALGEGMDPCLIVADRFPTGARVGRDYRWGWQTIDLRVRALYAAVAWAQDPDTDWSMVKSFDLCGHGVTPAIYGRWLAAGFTTAQALPFWKHKATLDAALPWLAAGKTTDTAARHAAKGRRPDGQEPWRAAEFTDAEALPWQGMGLSPAAAERLRDAGFTAPTYKYAIRDSRGGHCGALTTDQALAAARAGVAPAVMGGLWSATDGQWDEFVEWGRVGARDYEYRLLTNPLPGKYIISVTAALTAAETADWLDAGFPPAHLHLLPEVKGVGLAPQHWREHAGPVTHFSLEATASEVRHVARMALGRIVPD